MKTPQYVVSNVLKIGLFSGLFIGLVSCATEPNSVEASSSVTNKKLGSDADFMTMACVDFTTQDKASIEADLKKYQGWTKIYEVEDVTLNDAIPKDGNLPNAPSQGMVCFEKREE